MEENQDKKQEITIISQTEIQVSRLTEEIKNDLKTAAQSLIRACVKIAEVRERKLYKAIGCKNFEEYCEKMLSITRKQGGKYATIGSAFSNYIQNGKSTSHFQNAQSTVHFSPETFQQLSVEKLYLMARTDEAVREEVARAVDLNEVTVKELKAKITELEKHYRSIEDKLERTEKSISEQVKTVERNVSEIVREGVRSQPAPPEGGTPAPETAPAKASFILYSSYISFIEEFTDEEAGELLKAIMLYVNSRPVPALSKGVRGIYRHIINQLDKDFSKWQDIKQKRAESGKKGGLQTQENNRKNEANACFAKANQAVNVNDNVNVNVNANDFALNQSIDRSAGAERKKQQESVENYAANFEAYREIVRDNIEYDDYMHCLIENGEKSMSVDELDNIVDIIVRAICSTKENERICKSTYPREVIKSVMLKVDRQVIENVIEQMQGVINIRNYEKYLISSLFNEANGKHFRKNAEGRSIDYAFERNFGKELRK